MLERLVLGVGLCVALAAPASAEVLRFSGTFDTLYDCLNTSPGPGCGSPEPVAIHIPFTFTLEITELLQQRRTDTSAWVAPQFPMPPPVTQTTFESLADRNFARIVHSNTYEGGPIIPNLLSFVGATHVWTGTDAQGRSHFYDETLSVTFDGGARAAPGTPITFDEVVALWDRYRSTGQAIDVFTQADFGISRPDGSVVEVGGHRLTGHFRLCRAPGAVSNAVASVVARARGS